MSTSTEPLQSVTWARTFLMRRRQRFTVDVPATLAEQMREFPPTSEHDQYVCDNGTLVLDTFDLLDDDQLAYAALPADAAEDAGADVATLVDAARTAWSALVAVAPVEAYALLERFAVEVRDADLPAVTVGTDEHGATVLIDPYTHAPTRLIDRDVAFADTRGRADHAERTVAFVYDQRADNWETYAMVSESSGKPVSLPEGYDLVN